MLLLLVLAFGKTASCDLQMLALLFSLWGADLFPPTHYYSVLPSVLFGTSRAPLSRGLGCSFDQCLPVALPLSFFQTSVAYAGFFLDRLPFFPFGRGGQFITNKKTVPAATGKG